MGTKIEREEFTVKRLVKIVREHGRGHFITVLRYLERTLQKNVRIGELGPVDQEPFFLRHDPSLSFSTSDIAHIEERSQGMPSIEIMSTFLGLVGTTTPLPSYFAQEVATEPEGKSYLRDFLDVFHHRILSLFYRSVTRYDYSSEFQSDCSDAWSKRVLALAGLDIDALDSEVLLPRWRLLRLAPLLAHRSSSLWGLQAALQDVLEENLGGATVAIEQFVGSWVPIDASQRTQLGVANSTLGVDTVIGQSSYDRTSTFQIVLAPLPYRAYSQLRNDTKLRERIAATVGLFCSVPLDYNLRLVLDQTTIPLFRMSNANRPKLGINSFLGSSQDMDVIVKMRSLVFDFAASNDTLCSALNGEA